MVQVEVLVQVKELLEDGPWWVGLKEVEVGPEIMDLIIGIWNGIGIPTMTNFIPHSQFSGPSQTSKTVKPTFLLPNNQQNASSTSTNKAPHLLDLEVERQQSIFGAITFSSQASSTGVHVY
ncbi:hypothetical protein ACH5RR_037978 [Cinchona calisaya]|uniref:Uncharacterized protein n=1 Tax=Cinchona calisaya TaxID=153742 RepID=A0ABD2YBF9_9GENT